MSGQRKKRPLTKEVEALWSHHHAEWRDQAQIISHWQGANKTDAELLKYQVQGHWWETLAACGITLVVTREYEHLVMALRSTESGPHLSYLPMPHPSGLAYDKARHVVHIASTRNPNQIYDLVPVSDGSLPRNEKGDGANVRVLVPIRSRFFPGSLYLHDLAMIGGNLHGNAVGQNAVVRLKADGSFKRVWWPRAIEANTGPIFNRNYLQLNSIAAAETVADSFFSASTDKIGSRRPGHRDFPVKERGVIFSGATREPVARGLTRPHSARLHRRKIWFANSGYGQLAFVEDGGFNSVARLPGWTRGLCFHGNIAFVGTSRVIPDFKQYAPGLDVDKSRCGIHAVDVRTGRVLGSLIWPRGNQIFAIQNLPAKFTCGFPLTAGRRRSLERERKLFYDFTVRA